MKDNYAWLIAAMNEIHKIIRAGDSCFLPEQSRIYAEVRDVHKRRARDKGVGCNVTERQA